MERIIKFRAYDTEENKYFEPTYEAYKGKLEDLSVTFSGEIMRRTLQFPAEHESMFPGRYILEQWTGRKDRNGVEIYEGDIIISSQNDYMPTEVFWDEQCCQFSTQNYHSTLNLVDSIDSKVEIIGNIHTK